MSAVVFTMMVFTVSQQGLVTVIGTHTVPTAAYCMEAAKQINDSPATAYNAACYPRTYKAS